MVRRRRRNHLSQHNMVLRSRVGNVKFQKEILEKTKEMGFLFDNHRVYSWKVMWRRYQKNLAIYNAIKQLYDVTKA
jgi:hypothetical protein